jgi:hypothetical protein
VQLPRPTGGVSGRWSPVSNHYRIGNIRGAPRSISPSILASCLSPMQEPVSRPCKLQTAFPLKDTMTWQRPEAQKLQEHVGEYSWDKCPVVNDRQWSES